MRAFIVAFLMIFFAGCASVPATTAIPSPFHDELFAPPSDTIRASDVFALNEPMRRYLRQEIASELKHKGLQRGLIDALYDRQQLHLEYDAEKTRTAAEAFEARSGNCLSLVLMTSAFAKELGLPVYYNQVFVDEAWSRSGDLHFLNGHVNLVLGYRPIRAYASVRTILDDDGLFTIDFLRPTIKERFHSRDVSENTIIAMFMNNRAAEAIQKGRLTDAYWWVREAIVQDPRFTAAYNTLGVVYRRSGHLNEAEKILREVLLREPANVHTVNNLAVVLKDAGKDAESKALFARLNELQPIPPFHYFDLGMKALRDRDFASAVTLFQKEVHRDAYYHEVHFWLAAAHMGLGETRQARKHLELALENSTTAKQQAIYAAKLERVKSHLR